MAAKMFAMAYILEESIVEIGWGCSTHDTLTKMKSKLGIEQNKLIIRRK